MKNHKKNLQNGVIIKMTLPSIVTVKRYILMESSMESSRRHSLWDTRENENVGSLIVTIENTERNEISTTASSRARGHIKKGRIRWVTFKLRTI